MKLNGAIIKGHVMVVVTDVETGERWKVETDNVITSAGIALLQQAWLTGKFVAEYKKPDETYQCPNDISLYRRPQWAIVLGTGSGTPDVSDTGLFNPINASARGEGQDGLSISVEDIYNNQNEKVGERLVITPLPWGADAKLEQLSNGWRYWARYMPEELNGQTITEVGVYENIPFHWYSYTPTVGGNPVYEHHYIPPQEYQNGQLFEHAMLPSPIEKDDTKMIDVYVSIYVNQV